MTAPDRAGFAAMFRAVHQDPAAQTIADFLADTAGLFAITVANTLGENYPETEDDPYAANVFLILAGLRSVSASANDLIALLHGEPPPAPPEDPTP